MTRMSSRGYPQRVVFIQGGTRCPQGVGKQMRLCRLISALAAVGLPASSAAFAKATAGQGRSRSTYSRLAIAFGEVDPP
jgi:hypothetical protein